ncbi:DUF3592 domain-containing protein [Kitasatospora sp. NPDC089913]|uniref:DUF3592 domain-containing protein n=1 Tax=Streptomycetaceae TaxID=2062 RepID=UPI000879E94E|nr:DUF3592 domain-containing protein [Streptomyces sp. TLI_053]SDT78942.1 hypothetical protein SAMN05216371_5882 [Streptomyces sp. TLI_053]
MNLLALLIGTVFAGSSYWTGSRASRTFRIHRFGTRHRARVVAVTSTPVGDEGGYEDTVRVRFEVAVGPAVEATTSIALRGPTGLRPGDEVDVAHLPRFPDKVVVLGLPSADGVGLLGYACVLFAVMTVFFFWVAAAD